MIQISSKQAEFIRKHSPTSTIVVINKDASKKEKKNYQAEETSVVKKLLKQYSEEVEKVIYTYGKVD